MRPPVAAAKKLVLDSRVAVLKPSAAVPTAPTVSASAISVPPCTAAVVVFSSPRTSSSPTTRSGVASTMRIPRWAIRPLFHSSMTGSCADEQNDGEGEQRHGAQRQGPMDADHGATQADRDTAEGAQA